MIDPVTARRLAHWAIFAAIAAVVVFLRILPLDVTAGRFPGPDLTLVLAFVWVLRRPDFVPVFLLAGVLLLNDIIFMRPPGLWAGLGIVGYEFLRGRAQISREQPFMVEWALVSAVLLVMMLANRLVLTVFFIAQPNLGLDVVLTIVTAAVYPAVVFVSTYALGVQKLAPGAPDSKRRST